jgi:hypothetical protein
MSTFKCGLRRFDGQGTRYTERVVNTEATREMESALERLRRSRDQQDAGCFVAPTVANSIPEPILKNTEIKKPSGPCYSLSDASVVHDGSMAMVKR